MRAGDWLVRALSPFGTGIGSLVPDGFAAYARILQPAWRGRAKVRWRELATGPIEPGTRFEALAAEGVHAPFTGTLTWPISILPLLAVTRHSREKARVQSRTSNLDVWVPAFAGMTNERRR